ncbi:MAG: hypothetical protein HY898_35900 [Deltaproteobacteria bacterium]|nr:hypothetical protein [Deltaproteobacteria bacterium]
MRQVWILTAAALVTCTVAIACGNTAQQPAPVDPTTAPRKTQLPTCRWIPVAPEWNEPCSQTNHGAKLEVTIREDNRPENAKKQTATCECD